MGGCVSVSSKQVKASGVVLSSVWGGAENSIYGVILQPAEYNLGNGSQTQQRSYKIFFKVLTF